MSGKFVISLDFEKYWGVRDHKSISDYRENLDNVDLVVKRTLKLFDMRKIHATWATVGFMFFEDKIQLIEMLDETNQLYSDISLNPYKYIEFNELIPKYHFSSQQIGQILSTPFQEIASHTFSHYYCLEEGQNIVDFKFDCDRFQEISKEFGVNVKTIIFPRNQINTNYLEVLVEKNIYAYRGTEEHPIYEASSKQKNTMFKRILRFLDRYINLTGHHTYKIDKSLKVINVKSSRFLAPYNKKLALLDRLRLNRIKKSMTYAAKNNQVFHLWWHPHNFGKNIEENFSFLNGIISHYQHLNSHYGFESKNINEIVSEM